MKAIRTKSSAVKATQKRKRDGMTETPVKDSQGNSVAVTLGEAPIMRMFETINTRRVMEVKNIPFNHFIKPAFDTMCQHTNEAAEELNVAITRGIIAEHYGYDLKACTTAVEAAAQVVNNIRNIMMNLSVNTLIDCSNQLSKLHDERVIQTNKQVTQWKEQMDIAVAIANREKDAAQQKINEQELEIRRLKKQLSVATIRLEKAGLVD